MTLLISETHINLSKGYRFGDNEPYDTDLDSVGELFKRLQQEYGRCTSKVYIDTKEGTKAIGWVFVKKDKYEDTGEPFLHETWISVHEAEPETSTKYHYANLEMR